MGIVAVAVLTLNLPVLAVNNELCPLILADPAPCIDRIRFRLLVAADTVCTGFLNIPTTLWVGDYVM